MIDQATELRNLMKKRFNNKVKKTKIITVVSEKCELEQSNFSINLSLSLRNKGKKVLIIDSPLEANKENISNQIHSEYNIMDIIQGKLTIGDVITENYLGISVISGVFGLDVIENLDEEEKKIFLDRVSELNKYDYILINTKTEINKNILAFIASSEEIIMIISSEEKSLTNSYSLLKTISYLELSNNIKIVVNKVEEKEEAIKTFIKIDRATNRFLKISLKYLGYITENLCLSDAKSDESISKIANKIIINDNKNVSNNSIYDEVGATELFKRMFKIFS